MKPTPLEDLKEFRKKMVELMDGLPLAASVLKAPYRKLLAEIDLALIRAEADELGIPVSKERLPWESK